MTGQPSHELALMRALHHLQELECQVASWRERDGYLVIHNFERESGEYVVLVEEVNAPSTATFSGIVGDCLHNLSSSLNFLVFDLARAYTNPLPEKVADKLAFPIFGNVDRQGRSGTGPRSFRSGRKERIGSLAPGAQTEIEGLQPYQRGNTFTEDPLWRLHELARFNRHRFLHLAVVALSGMVLDPAATSNAILGRSGPWTLQVHEGFVEGRTEVARFP